MSPANRPNPGAGRELRLRASFFPIGMAKLFASKAFSQLINLPTLVSKLYRGKG
jgi:hypothetical protein